MTAPEQRLAIVRIVATYWRTFAKRAERGMLELHEVWNAATAVDALARVLDAIDGETNPNALDIPEGRTAKRIRAIAEGEQSST